MNTVNNVYNMFRSQKFGRRRAFICVIKNFEIYFRIKY